MHCTEYNATSRDGAVYCEYCGKKFASPEPSNLTDNITLQTQNETGSNETHISPESAPQPAPQPIPSLPTNYNYPPPYAQYPPPMPKKSNTGLIIGLILGGAFLLVLIAIIVVIMLFSVPRSNFIERVETVKPPQVVNTNVSEVQMHQYWQGFGYFYNNTVSEVINRFVSDPIWHSHNEIVEVFGRLHGSNELLVIIWNIDIFGDITINSITIDDTTYTNYWDMDDFMWFMLEAMNDGFWQLPIEDWWSFYYGWNDNWEDDHWVNDDWWLDFDDDHIYMVDPALVGIWHIIDLTASGWFVGGETLEFLSDGFGIERLSWDVWEFEWFAEDGNLLMLYHNGEEFDYIYEIVDGDLHLYDEIGRLLIFNRR